MITSTDSEYLATKLVKQGKVELPEIFRYLIDWINIEYKVKAINVLYDIILPDKRPRIQVIFEDFEHVVMFRDKGIGNFLQDRQNAISNKFVQLVTKLNLEKTYEIENVFVCYSDFSSIYKSEIYSLVPEKRIEKLIQKYTSNLIWKIHINGAGLTVFFYSNYEKSNPQNDCLLENLKEEYFSLLKPFDEFNYLESAWIKRESKEDFDDKYDSNWFYWSKSNFF